MADKYVFRGVKWRVQLTIIDFTTPDTPPALRRERPNFAVCVLPSTANPNTAFSRGEQVYYGNNPDAAWDAMQRRVPNLRTQCPRRLREYLLRWGDV